MSSSSRSHANSRLTCKEPRDGDRDRSLHSCSWARIYTSLACHSPSPPPQYLEWEEKPTSAQWNGIDTIGMEWRPLEYKHDLRNQLRLKWHCEMTTNKQYRSIQLLEVQLESTATEESYLLPTPPPGPGYLATVGPRTPGLWRGPHAGTGLPLHPGLQQTECWGSIHVHVHAGHMWGTSTLNV